MTDSLGQISQFLCTFIASNCHEKGVIYISANPALHAMCTIYTTENHKCFTAHEMAVQVFHWII